MDKIFEKFVKAIKTGLEKAFESGGRLEHVYTLIEEGSYEWNIAGVGRSSGAQVQALETAEGMGSLGGFASYF